MTFDTLIVADRRESIGQHYAFDGQWVVEKTPADKQFTKRQVVPPGEDFDPLRIGEGPFPVPVGQRKADILDRFDAEILPATPAHELLRALRTCLAEACASRFAAIMRRCERPASISSLRWAI